MSHVSKLIVALNEIGHVSCNMKVGNGMHTKFWLDISHTDNTLAFIYHQLFVIFFNPNISVFQVVMSKGQVLQFKDKLQGFCC
jgi:small neutral amino acid transporter SnatA (MarC family)